MYSLLREEVKPVQIYLLFLPMPSSVSKYYEMGHQHNMALTRLQV